MSKSWWWKAGFIIFVTLMALVYLVPTVVQDESSLPRWFAKRFDKKIQRGLDLQGGLHLVYEVQVDKAASDKADRLATDLEDHLRKERKLAGVTTERSGRDEILVKFKSPADARKLDSQVLKEYGAYLNEIGRDEAAGVVSMKLDARYIGDLEDYAIRQGIETIRGRVDKFGVAEPTIIRRTNDIIVELPGLSTQDFERIKQVIGRTAQLEFKIVEDGPHAFMQEAEKLVGKDSGITVDNDVWSEKDSGVTHRDTYLTAKTRDVLEKFFASLPADKKVPATHEVGYELVDRPDRSGGKETPERYWRSYLLKRRAVLTGESLTDADVMWDQQTGRPEVSVTLDREGATIFERVSGENIGRKLAIILDEKINSAPVIESRIPGGRVRITLGGYGDPQLLTREAKDLVAVLRTGALPAPLKKSFETAVGPTLGKDAIDKAKVAIAIGGSVVVAFMLFYYRLSGLIANFAMLLNICYLLSVLAMFGAAMTLPGIAGVALTIGMAVDGNIIIYERIREELRSGKGVRAAVDAGFKRAFWTIVDGHLANFVAGLILYSYGSGPIRGFAVTLNVGIICNLFTSLFVSRTIFQLVTDRRKTAPTTLSI